jgi:hypothetical protein
VTRQSSTDQGGASQGRASQSRASQSRASQTTSERPAAYQVIDDAAAQAFETEYAGRSSQLPPVAFVIAAYNEEGAIGPVVDALPATICGLATATIVVSDGSADGTVKEAHAHGALVCDVPVNRGQGAALRLGYRLARDGGARYIVTTDADGQYDPADAQLLLEPVLAGHADFVTGSRRLGSEETKDPVRKLGVRVFALTISLLAGQRITDPSFGMRAMRAEVTAAVNLQQPQYQAAELLIGVIVRGFRVTERPATIRRRRVGESKKGHNVLYGLRFARVIVSTWWRERQRSTGATAVSPSNASSPNLSPAIRGRGAAAKAAASGGRMVADEVAAAAGTSSDTRAESMEPRSAKRT